MILSARFALCRRRRLSERHQLDPKTKHMVLFFVLVLGLKGQIDFFFLYN